jgi:hypothetical protein
MVLSARYVTEIEPVRAQLVLEQAEALSAEWMAG